VKIGSNWFYLDTSYLHKVSQRDPSQPKYLYQEISIGLSKNNMNIKAHKQILMRHMLGWKIAEKGQNEKGNISKDT
jgi:hypothetical protein